MDLDSPEVILRNEKRLLQRTVDALFDNGRCRRPVLGSSNRPLKSITDMLKGKQGRFRENLLGKRVDYSARSVIVVGPELKIWQCGLPKKIALELYQPFIIRKLKEHGLADTIKSAKRMLERRDPEVWDILEQVIKNHPVILNRAPTLHRMGIQAFEPVLVEGNAIKIHPLVCTGYNADFDGDQMAIHLPLSVEAQAETHMLMMSTHNLFSPANGSPIVGPSQDIVLGLYFLTCAHGDRTRPVRWFKDMDEALQCFELSHGDPRKISFHDPIVVRLERFDEVVYDKKLAAEPMPANRRVVTTLGRLLFSEILPDGTPFYNCTLDKDGATRVIDDTFARNGKAATIELLDAMKSVGFRYSTVSGLSLAITDLRVPKEKQAVVDATQREADAIASRLRRGELSERAANQRIKDLWSRCASDVNQHLAQLLASDRREVLGQEFAIDTVAGARFPNPAHLFVMSGARGSHRQLANLSGFPEMGGSPAGNIGGLPIRSNFREGLSAAEYLFRAVASRREMTAVVEFAPKAGHLLRRLCDAARSLVVLEDDCGVPSGIPKKAIYKDEEVDVPLRDIVRGRTSVETIINPVTDEVIVKRNEIITDVIARKIEDLGLTSVYVRSPLTCRTARGVCAKCYGQDMSTGKPVEIGMAVGIIAAQSIGEPLYRQSFAARHGVGVRSIRSTFGRIEDLFEARARPRHAILAEIAGRVSIRPGSRKGKVTIVVTDDAGVGHKHHVPETRGLLVQSGLWVEAGEALTDGPPNPADLLRLYGEDALFSHFLAEVQDLYRTQGFVVLDSHFEVILRQMVSKVRVSDPGDTALHLNDVVDEANFHKLNDALADRLRVMDPGETTFRAGAVLDGAEIRAANAKARAEGKRPCQTRSLRPASATAMLHGITKTALLTDSFLSRASFQETTQVLTDAALQGATDELRGLKENVLLGHLIPAGTGFDIYARTKVKRLVAVPDHDSRVAEAFAREDDLDRDAIDAIRRAAIATMSVEDRLASAPLPVRNSQGPI
jgi:DNA-directed RNA polymerase subunit beta'